MEYKALCRRLQDSFETGNIPQAEAIIKEDLPEKFEGYRPPAPLKSPEEIIADYSEKIKAANRDMSAMQRLFRHYVDERNKEKALEKLEELQKKFPAHPFIEEAEEELRRNGLLEE